MATQTQPQSGSRADSVRRESPQGLEGQGLSPKGDIHWNLSAPELFQAALRRG